MYQVQIRLYVVSGKIHAGAEYQRDYRQDNEILTTAHITHLVPPDSPLSPHEENLFVADLVCQELDQNLGLPLF